MRYEELIIMYESEVNKIERFEYLRLVERDIGRIVQRMASRIRCG